MTFLNDLWKKFKTLPTTTTNVVGKLSTPDISEAPTPVTTEALYNTQIAFEVNEEERLQREKLLNNLKVLKELIELPKEENPDFRSTKINLYLGEEESHETLRRDRWPEKIRCPSCQSIQLKRLSQIAPKSPHNHRYRCLDCGLEFSDDSDSPMEKEIPPINIWMHCWYLMGCTDSLNYIASKLGLDLSTVEHMVRELQKFFNAQKPLTQFLKFEEWDKQAAHLRKQLQNDLLKQYEFLDANIATAPKDTTEFRRQQNLRRNITPSIDPTAPTIGKKKF